MAERELLWSPDAIRDLREIADDIALDKSDAARRWAQTLATAAELMAMAFRLAQAAVLGLNLVHLDRALALAHNTALEVGQRDALVSELLEAHAAGYDLGLLFFAINCLLVAVLLVRSRVVPRVIGLGVGAAGVVYLVGSVLRIVAPALVEVVAPAYAIPLLAELGFCGWLIVRGLDVASARPPSRAWARL